MTPAEIWLRLSGIKGAGNQHLLQVANILKMHGHPDKDDLVAAGLYGDQITQFYTASDAVIERTLRWLESPQHYLIPVTDPFYPDLLKTIANAPLLLFAAGDPSVLSVPQLAVVGSRNCSHYGHQWGTWFTQALALSGLVITSGLARGVDGVAHRAALNIQGKTIAVLGSGLQHIYPRLHLSLAEEIIASGGAVISEFPLSMPPYPHNFPRRNRIISGLSLGVLVIEASIRSGSLITARYALEHNRDVFALPGGLGHENSEGGHWLIQQGALLVAHPNNIIEQLQTGFKWLSFPAAPEIYSADNTDVSLPFPDVLANVGDEVTPVDVVADRAGQPVPVIVTKLLELELAGWIAAVPGGYVRVRRASHVRRTNVLV